MKNIEELLDRVGIFSTPIVVYIAYILGISSEIIGIALAVLVVFLSLYLLRRNTYLNPNKEINLFKTFWYDEFFGVKLGEKLNVTANIFVIEGKSKNEIFSKSLDRHFKDAFNKDEFATPRFKWKYSDSTKLQIELRGELKNKKAVLVVRSKELDKQSWVYKLVDEWALKNPEAPCLYVDDTTEDENIDVITEDEDIDVSKDKAENIKIPEKYYSIDYKPKLVPWALLQRSNDRSFAWRSQSSFNRLMWKHTVIFVPILLSLLMVIYLEKKTEISNLKAEKETEILNLKAQKETEISNLKAEQKTIFQIHQDEIARGVEREIKAKEIKDEQSNKEASSKSDGKLFVSYWLIDKNDPNMIIQVGTSDPDANRTPWKREENNIVGCSFVNHDHFIEWKLGDSFAKVTSVKGIEKQNVKCPFLDRKQDKIKSIACFAENKSGDPQMTAGVCIKTEFKTFISQYDYRDLLSEKALGFYNQNLKTVKATSH